MYVYIRSEPRLWTVGFYSPDGTWHPDSDHETPEKAAERVRSLNGILALDLAREQRDALKLYMAIDSARHAGVRISAATWADAWQASTAAIAKAREAIP